MNILKKIFWIFISDTERACEWRIRLFFLWIVVSGIYAVAGVFLGQKNHFVISALPIWLGMTALYFVAGIIGSFRVEKRSHPDDLGGGM